MAYEDEVYVKLKVGKELREIRYTIEFQQGDNLAHAIPVSHASGCEFRHHQRRNQKGWGQLLSQRSETAGETFEFFFQM